MKIKIPIGYRITIVIFFILFSSSLLRSEEKKNYRTGIIPDFGLKTRLHSNPEDYFSGSIRKKMKEYVDIKKWPDEDKKALDSISYDISAQSAFLYVPGNYDGGDGWGLFVHISPSDKGGLPGGWDKIMEKQKMIFVSANGTQNSTSTIKRVVMSLDAMASVRKEYKIASGRIIVSGLSGGGLMSMLTAINYPEYFEGAISHSAMVFIIDQDYDGIGGSFLKYIPEREIKDLAKKSIRWAFVSGTNDYNYKHIVECMKGWNKMGFDVKFFEQPAMGHANCNEEWLDKIITWIEEKTNASQLEKLTTLYKANKFPETYKLANDILKKSPACTPQYKKAEEIRPELDEKANKISEKILSNNSSEIKEINTFINDWGKENPCTAKAREVFNSEGVKNAEALLAKEPHDKNKLKAFLSTWGDYPCAAPVKSSFDKIGAETFKQLKESKAGIPQLISFVKYWAGCPCAEQPAEELNASAEKELNNLISKPALTCVQVTGFMKKWEGFPVYEKALGELSKLAEKELSEIQKVKNEFSKKSKLSSFIKKYEGTEASQKAQEILSSLSSRKKHE
jgi:predicted esterase